MHIMYDDKNANRSGASNRLILLNSGWHIVAPGYLCKVTDGGEGRQMIAMLSAASIQKHPSIDKPPTDSYTSRPGTP